MAIPAPHGAQAAAKEFAERIQAPCNSLHDNEPPVTFFQPGGRVPPGTSHSKARHHHQGAAGESGQGHPVQRAQPHLSARRQLPLHHPGAAVRLHRLRAPHSHLPGRCAKLEEAGKVAEAEAPNWESTVTLPDRGDEIDKTAKARKPYFELSGACEGCGETPHANLITQPFGELGSGDIDGFFQGD